jgi:hypothetical protein
LWTKKRSNPFYKLLQKKSGIAAVELGSDEERWERLEKH